MTDPAPENNEASRKSTRPPRINSHKQFRDEMAALRARLSLSLQQLDHASQQLGRDKRLPPATVSNVLNRDRLPEWDFVADYLAACGLSEDERHPWRDAWQELRARGHDTPDEAAQAAAAPALEADPAAGPHHRGRARAARSAV
ncbi:helix-turn-helix domain-containing protein [Streptomyces sp. NPDC059467]|uniref:helix-turn-helix domain-containing protein n=1 Tax=Streptomyces sp. NPDC059467 TaxID=3346844 RepID=UPI0036CFAFF9